jgi:probable F420-dependent oxidoreductase
VSAAYRSRLGRIGAWFHPGYGDEARTQFAVEAETLGYPVAWLGFGPASVADLAVVEQILQATSTIVVATAIVNMWTNDADEVAASYRRLTSRYGDRVLLGVGIGHPEANSDYRQPYATMVDYLDRLDAGGVPPDRRILAALGPPSTTAGRCPIAGQPPLPRGPRSHPRGPQHARAGCRDRTRADSRGRN